MNTENLNQLLDHIDDEIVIISNMTNSMRKPSEQEVKQIIASELTNKVTTLHIMTDNLATSISEMPRREGSVLHE